MLFNRVLPAAVLCAALVAGATGCGGSKGPSNDGKAAAPASPSVSAAPSASASAAGKGLDFDGMTAHQIDQAARKALADASTVRLSGDLVQPGLMTIIDIYFDNRKDCHGTFDSDKQGSLELIHNADGTWLKGDAAFWQAIAAQKGKASAGSGLAAMFKDRYLSGGQDDPDLKQLAAMCGLIADMTSEDPSTVSKGGPGNIDSSDDAFTIEEKGVRGQDITMYVAAQGTPYPRRIKSEGGAQVFDLFDFNQPVTIQAPPADQVIDYDTFKKQVQSV